MNHKRAMKAVKGYHRPLEATSGHSKSLKTIQKPTGNDIPHLQLTQQRRSIILISKKRTSNFFLKNFTNEIFVQENFWLEIEGNRKKSKAIGRI